VCRRVLDISDTHRPFDPGAGKRCRIDAEFGGTPAGCRRDFARAR
jgi:hypothetical protein